MKHIYFNVNMMKVYDLHVKLYNGVKLLLKRKGGRGSKKGNYFEKNVGGIII